MKEKKEKKEQMCSIFGFLNGLVDALYNLNEAAFDLLEVLKVPTE